MICCDSWNIWYYGECIQITEEEAELLENFTVILVKNTSISTAGTGVTLGLLMSIKDITMMLPNRICSHFICEGDGREIFCCGCTILPNSRYSSITKNVFFIPS